MPLNISYPLVNGHRYSWASVEINIAGTVIRGVSSIDYGDSLTPGKMRGTGPQVIGRTRGEYDADAELEMYRQEFDFLKTQLGNGFGEVSFSITVSYSEAGSPTVTDTLDGCRITKPRTGGAEGTDPTKMKLSLDVLRISYGDLSLVSPPSVGA